MKDCIFCASARVVLDESTHPPRQVMGGCCRIEFLGLSNEEANPLRRCEYWRDRNQVADGRGAI